ncbi:hypothetical protein [Paenibacillus sp. FJAT-26967]|uniref:hypothetical protein n=1 Tax=Paenibacillus sp. FJAT-26967 TaxID=1729690 RepID=UPI000838055B|nr:hypothetical protein [Paenibacillus sp. FJAT-26967]
MLNNKQEEPYNEIMVRLEEIIFEVSIILLTKKDLTEEAMQRVYSILEEMQSILKDENRIPKSLTSMLFAFYKRAEAEMSYRKPINSSQSNFIGHLQTYIGRIFGEN